jgi:hypothetical protein
MSHPEPPGHASSNAAIAPAALRRLVLRSATGEDLVVDVPGPLPAWSMPVLRSLQELLGLPAGWDSYAARPLSPEAAMAALRLLLRVMHANTPPPAVVPLSCGGVQLEWHRGGMDIELTVPVTGPVEVWCEDLQAGTEREFSLGQHVDELVGLLCEMTRRSQ